MSAARDIIESKLSRTEFTLLISMIMAVSALAVMSRTFSGHNFFSCARSQSMRGSMPVQRVCSCPDWYSNSGHSNNCGSNASPACSCFMPLA